MIIDGADEGLCKLALSAAVALKETGIKPDVIIPVPGEGELFCAPELRFKRKNSLFVRLVRGKTGLFCSGGTVLSGATEIVFTFREEKEADSYGTVFQKLTGNLSKRNFVCKSVRSGREIKLTALWYDSPDLETLTMAAARLTADADTSVATTLAYSPFEQDVGLLSKVFGKIRPDGPLEPCFDVKRYIAVNENTRRLYAVVKVSDENKAAAEIAKLMTAVFTEE